MDETQKGFIEKIRAAIENTTDMQIEYWKSYSDFDNWQFWLVLAMIVLPLIVLMLFIDRHRTLQIGFFGLNYHVWFHYTNGIGINLGLWEYPFQIIPFLPSFALDAALVPVCSMLLYQWTLNRRKNTYLYAVILSAIFAFVMKPIMVSIHLFHMYKGVNYFYLFLVYFALFVVSKIALHLFLWLQKGRTPA